MIRRLTALFALLWLGPVDTALAQQRPAYPSLARRPVESRDREAEIAAARQAQAVAPAAEDPALSAEVTALGEKAQAASAAFDARFESSQRSVTAGRAATIGSEAWVVAQQAISLLDSDRYDSVAALATLDTLYVERSNLSDRGRAAADTATIDRERMRVLAMVDRQNDRLDTLKAGLTQP